MELALGLPGVAGLTGDPTEDANIVSGLVGDEKADEEKPEVACVVSGPSCGCC